LEIVTAEQRDSLVDSAKLRVSVVIPVYNEEDTIGSCLDSVFNQKVAADEVIVVDNGSTDATTDRVGLYQDRVITICEPRRGVHYARTTGMDAASGDLIARIDADTVLPQCWVEQIRDRFADRTIGAVTGPVRYYDTQLPGLTARLDLLLRAAWAWAARQHLDWVFGSNMAIRADAWRTVRAALCQDRDMHEDVDLGIHLFDAGFRVIFAPELVAGVSARRIRDSFHEFSSYLRMTEHSFAMHAGVTSDNSLRRAWLTNRLIMMFYFPLRFLHYSYCSGWQSALRASMAARKNPMSGG
jgi:glycosyltransferase involved in cell wall biosynthesis